MRENNNDLIDRTSYICFELARYGDFVYCDELLDVLEKIVEINTDLHHGIRGTLTKQKVEETKALLDHFLLLSIKEND
jgi:hypothetical protein